MTEVYVHRPTLVRFLSLYLTIPIGGICMLLQIVLIGLYAQWSSFSEGIWAGAYIIILGIIGYLGQQRKTKCLMTSFLVLSVLCFSLIVPALFYLGFGSVMLELQLKVNHNREVKMSLYGIMAVLSLIQGVISIVATVLGCKSVGCCAPQENTQLLTEELSST